MIFACRDGEQVHAPHLCAADWMFCMRLPVLHEIVMTNKDEEEIRLPHMISSRALVAAICLAMPSWDSSFPEKPSVQEGPHVPPPRDWGEIFDLIIAGRALELQDLEDCSWEYLMRIIKHTADSPEVEIHPFFPTLKEAAESTLTRPAAWLSDDLDPHGNGSSEKQLIREVKLLCQWDRFYIVKFCDMYMDYVRRENELFSIEKCVKFGNLILWFCCLLENGFETRIAPFGPLPPFLVPPAPL